MRGREKSIGRLAAGFGLGNAGQKGRRRPETKKTQQPGKSSVRQADLFISPIASDERRKALRVAGTEEFLIVTSGWLIASLGTPRLHVLLPQVSHYRRCVRVSFNRFVVILASLLPRRGTGEEPASGGRPRQRQSARFHRGFSRCRLKEVGSLTGTST